MSELMERTLLDKLSGAQETTGKVTLCLPWPKDPAMADAARSAFNGAMCAEVKRLREARSWRQSDMATALGISEALVQKYETRSPLLHYLLPRFCTIMGLSLDGFFRTVMAQAMKTDQKRKAAEESDGKDEAA